MGHAGHLNEASKESQFCQATQHDFGHTDFTKNSENPYPKNGKFHITNLGIVLQLLKSAMCSSYL